MDLKCKCSASVPDLIRLGQLSFLAASETDVFTLMQGLNGGAAAQSSSNNSGKYPIISSSCTSLHF